MVPAARTEFPSAGYTGDLVAVAGACRDGGGGGGETQNSVKITFRPHIFLACFSVAYAVAVIGQARRKKQTYLYIWSLCG